MIQISVVLIVGEQRARGTRCLASILGQSLGDALEVLLIDAGAAATDPIAGSHHPRVRLLRPPPTASFGQMLADAVRESRGPLVAFLEEHCVVLPGWAEALVGADDRESVAALGGERHHRAPGNPLGDFMDLLDRGPWSPPAVDCAVPGLPGGNVAYRRDVLLRYGDRLATCFQSEECLHAQLVADGLTLRVVPGARYEHAYEDSLRAACARWYAMGWAAGATRTILSGWSPGQRIRHVVRRLATLPFTPIRRLVPLARGRPADRRLVLANVHAGLLYFWLFGIGDVLGTALGLRGMDARVRHSALNAPRHVTVSPGRASKWSG